MLTLTAFLIAIGLLIAVHEYGHYRMAVACGVRVLRFSIGFGKPLWRWQSKSSSTEFVLSAIPLGGFVKMLDEHEAPVDPALRHLAFNNQTLRCRTAIVAAGPLANLILAVLLYSVVNWIGVEQPTAVLARPVLGSVASQAGLTGGELVLRGGIEGALPDEITSFDDLRWLLTDAALEGKNVQLVVTGPQSAGERDVLLKLAELTVTEVDAKLFENIGIVGPLTRPVIGETQPEGAAAKAGLEAGDLVLNVDDTRIVDGQQLRHLIRASVSGRHQTWMVMREGELMRLSLAPLVQTEGQQLIGRIGAYVGSQPEWVLVRYGAVDGVWRAVQKTWDISALTIKMMGKMLIGEASLKNISGPLTIADYAGKSADMGLTPYLVFLALVSVSLGVLNLLPLPVLDGGHLMYYLWEAVTGKPVSQAWVQRMQQGGVAILTVMMSIAIFNDISRLFG